jgi:ribosomal protein S18 acetylase RimI-like enzyme
MDQSIPRAPERKIWMISIRPLTKEDERALWEMLAHAAQEPTMEAVMNHPALARYVEGWGRAHDIGSIAIEASRPIGAAWLRRWTGQDRGFGYIDDAIPELAIAVLPLYRGQGVGTRLLSHLLETARFTHPSISLAVRATNRAARLYERLGFEKVKGSEMFDPRSGWSYKMKIDLHGDRRPI